MSAELFQKSYPIGRFEGTNFSVWRAKLEAYLRTLNKEYVLTKGKPRRILQGEKEEIAKREEEIKKFEEDDNVVKSIILCSLADKYCMIVQNQITAQAMWERLVLTQEQKTSESLVNVQRRFFNLKLRKDEEVESYIARGEVLYIRAQEAGIKGISNETLVNTLLAGLPRSYHTFVTSFMNQSQRTYPDLVSRLCVEEELQNKYNRKQRVDEAHYTEQNKARGASKGSKAGKSSKGRGRPRDDKVRKKGCYICHNEGHNFYDCPKFDPDYKSKKDKKRKDQEDNKEAPREGKKDTAKKEETGMMVEEASYSCSKTSSSWIIDTGASSHMTYDQDEFVEYEDLADPVEIRFAGSQRGHGIGIGRVKIITNVNGTKREDFLNNVLYVPELRRKLFSLSAATKKGCRGEFIDNKIVIRGPDNTVRLTAKRVNNLYYADVHCIECNAAHEEVNEVEDIHEGQDVNLVLWHQRMGHINTKYLVKTSKAVQGMEGLKEDRPDGSPHDTIKCQACCIGKQAKRPIPSRRSPRAEEVGQRVHVDVGGPVGATTLSGGKYYIIFKDEFSNYRFLFVMKSREEAHECIKKVVVAIIAYTKNHVRYIVSDSGSEFKSKRSQDYFSDKNIVHIKSAPFNSAQNGLIERENRTLMNGVRSILSNKKVPTNMWGEAAHTMVYLLNRSVNRVTIDKTPFELYYGHKPRVDHLKVFGSLAFVKTQTKKTSGYQPKVEERATKGILVGYEQDYTYRILDMESNKIICTRDVVFDEIKAPDQTDESYELIGDSATSDSGESEDSEEADVCEEDLDEPDTYEKALRSPQAEQWKLAMKEEYESLMKNNTWVLVDPPKGRKIVTGKWVFKIKYKREEVDRYKARYVARRFTRTEGIDFTDTFSPVSRIKSVRLLLILANHFQ